MWKSCNIIGPETEDVRSLQKLWIKLLTTNQFFLSDTDTDFPKVTWIMSLPIHHFRFSIFVLETLKLEWQCSQYLELNPTCVLAISGYVLYGLETSNLNVIYSVYAATCSICRNLSCCSMDWDFSLLLVYLYLLINQIEGYKQFSRKLNETPQQFSEWYPRANVIVASSIIIWFLNDYAWTSTKVFLDKLYVRINNHLSFSKC